MSARAHAERFLAACPADVRARAKFSDPRYDTASLMWWRSTERYVNLQFSGDGTVAVFFGAPPTPWFPGLSVDRLLSGYTAPQERSTANPTTAAATTVVAAGRGA